MVERVYHLKKTPNIEERMTIAINQFPIFANIDWETFDNMPEGTALTFIVKCRKEDMKSIDELLSV